MTPLLSDELAKATDSGRHPESMDMEMDSHRAERTWLYRWSQDMAVHQRSRAIYKLMASAYTLPERLACNSHLQALPAVPPQFRIDRDAGFKTVLPHEAWPSAKLLFARIKELLSQEQSRKQRNKPQMQELLSAEQIACEQAFLNFALDPLVVSVVADYLGELPILTQIRTRCSRATGSTQWKNSQLYHLDKTDATQIKIFMWLSDVAAENGPLTVVPAKESARLVKKLNYWFSRKIPDAEIRHLIPREAEFEQTGPAGMMSICDTSRCFHFGSRVTGSERWMVMFQYLTHTSFDGNCFRRLKQYPLAPLVRQGHTALERAVLSGHPL